MNKASRILDLYNESVSTEVAESSSPRRSSSSSPRRSTSGVQLLSSTDGICSKGIYVSLNLAVWGEFDNDKHAQEFIDDKLKSGLPGSRDYKIITGSTAIKLVSAAKNESKAAAVVSSAMNEYDPVSIGLALGAAAELGKAVLATGVAAGLGAKLVGMVRDRHNTEDMQKRNDNRLAMKCPPGTVYSRLSKKCISSSSTGRSPYSSHNISYS